MKINHYPGVPLSRIQTTTCGLHSSLFTPPSTVRLSAQDLPILVRAFNSSDRGAILMAAVSATTASKPFSYNRATFLFKPISYLAAPPTCFIQTPTRRNGVEFGYRRGKTLTVCLVVEEAKEIGEIESCRDEGGGDEIEAENRITAAALRAKRKKSERFTYLVAAIMSSTGITSLAVMALHYRFWWQMEGGEVPLPEIFTTFVLSLGAAVGMEFWARWAHRALWHASLWYMHESHHRPRDGLFELNDLFAIINAAPAISLLSYGFFTKGLFPGVCFGAGLGITMFGMAYMFVHDGLVHKRFPVGPIGNVPYFKKVAAAHQLHHSDKFNGVPYGLFLGPKVYGDEEWSFGFCDQGTGVFSCPAGKNPMYTYRESIVLGLTNLPIFNVNQIMRDLSREWPGHLYDLLSKNCNHFCDVLCERLGVPKLPGWVNRFANAGDAAMEAAGTTALRLRQARTEIVSASKVAYRYLLGVTSSPDSPNDSNRSSPRVQATWFKNLITSGAKPSSSSDIEDQGGSMLRQNRQNNTESLF